MGEARHGHVIIAEDGSLRVEWTGFDPTRLDHWASLQHFDTAPYPQLAERVYGLEQQIEAQSGEIATLTTALVTIARMKKERYLYSRRAIEMTEIAEKALGWDGLT